MICKIVLPPNEIYKLPAVPASFEELNQVTLRKFKDRLPEKIQFKYKDSEQDLITLANDEDLAMAIKTNESDNVKVLRIMVIPETNTEERDNLNVILFDNTTSNYENTGNYNTISTPSFYSSGGVSRDMPRKAVGGTRSSQRSNDTGSNGSFKNSSFSSQIMMNNNYLMDRNSINSQKYPFAGAKSMTFNMDRYSLHSQVAKEVQATPENMFTFRQMDILNQMLDDKFNELIEQKTIEAFQDCMKNHNSSSHHHTNNNNPNNNNYKIKITSESTINSITAAMSKSSVPAYGHSHSSQSKNSNASKKSKVHVKWGDEEWLCTLCDRKIQNVRYQCLECENFHCCESCEENVRHKHPLLKDRINKNQVDSDHETLDLSFNGSLKDTNEKFIPSNSSYTRMGSLTLMPNPNTTAKTSNSDDSGTKEMKSIISNVSRFGKESKTLKHSNTVHEFGSVNSSSSRKSEQPASNPRKRSSVFDTTRLSVGPPKHVDPIKHFLNSDDNLSSSNLLTTPGGGESKKYKVQISKANIYDLINVKCGEMYELVICIKNLSQDWPSFVKFVCINGVHKGHDEHVPPLGFCQKYELNLRLKAPLESGWHLSQWRLSYDDETGTKMFGSNIFVEINVKSGESNSGSRENPGSSSADDIKQFGDKSFYREDDISMQKMKDKKIGGLDFLAESGLSNELMSRSMEMDVNSMVGLTKSIEIPSKKEM